MAKMLTNTDREARLEHLRSVIQESPQTTQQELVKVMKRQGFTVTQASISRDLQALSVRKYGGQYTFESGSTTAQKFIHAAIQSIERAGDHLLVVKTIPGAANYVAELIDGRSWDGIVGTVAGDNTFFIAVKDKKSAATIVKRLEH